MLEPQYMHPLAGEGKLFLPLLDQDTHSYPFFLPQLGQLYNHPSNDLADLEPYGDLQRRKAVVALLQWDHSLDHRIILHFQLAQLYLLHQMYLASSSVLHLFRDLPPSGWYVVRTRLTPIWFFKVALYSHRVSSRTGLNAIMEEAEPMCTFLSRDPKVPADLTPI